MRVHVSHLRRSRMKPGLSASASVIALASSRLIPKCNAKQASQYECGRSSSSSLQMSEATLRGEDGAIRSPCYARLVTPGSRGGASVHGMHPRRYKSLDMSNPTNEPSRTGQHRRTEPLILDDSASESPAKRRSGEVVSVAFAIDCRRSRSAGLCSIASSPERRRHSRADGSHALGALWRDDTEGPHAVQWLSRVL